MLRTSEQCSERGEFQHSKRLEKQEIFQENEHLAVWVPDQLYIWFTDYLNRVSYDSSQADKIKVFLYRLQKLEEQRITIACMHKHLVHHYVRKLDRTGPH